MAAVQGEIQVRRDTSTNWLASNPVLGLGEPAFDSTVSRFKVGDGSTAWKSLGWATDTPLVPPPSTGWTVFNSGSITDNVDSRVNTLTASTLDMRGEYRTASISTNFTATFYLDIMAFPLLNYLSSGVVLKAAANAPIIHFGMQTDNGLGTGAGIGVTLWSNYTTFSAHYSRTSLFNMPNGMPKWLRVRDDATTRFYEFSYNNTEWWTYFSHARTTGVTPDQIGWGLSANNSGGAFTATARLLHFSGVA